MTASPSRPVPRFSALLYLWLAGAVALVVVPSTPAVAQADPAALARMKELYRQAVSDYAAQDFESSRIGLREAISVGERAGLGRDPLMARVLMAYGAVLLNGYNDKVRADRALTGAAILVPDLLPAEGMGGAAMTKAIAVARAKARVRARAMGMPQGAATPAAGAPGEEAPPPAEAPVAGEALPEVPAGPMAPPAVAAGPLPGVEDPAAAVPSSPDSAPVAAPEPPAAAPVARRKRRRGPGEEPDLPANIPQPLYCPSVDEAPPEEDIVLHCVLRPDLTATKVMMFYRPAGKETFSSSGATRSPAGWYRATIPGRVVEGRSLQYYLEARDPSGNAVANAGRDDSPNLLLVREEAPPLGKLYAGIARRRAADDDRDETDEPPEEDDPLRAVARQRERELQSAGRHVRRPGAIFGGLAAGSGYGWHPASRLEFYEKSTIEAGWIPSGRFQLVPEIGYQLSEQVALSLMGRVQFIAQKGSGDQQPGKPASGAFLLLGRLQYFLGAGNLQTALSLFGGGGDGFRLTIDPIPPNLRNDSVRGGPLCAGAGAGILYHFSEHLALAVDAKALYGFPTAAAVFDATTGLQVSF
jgi:hypothetical protein